MVPDTEATALTPAVAPPSAVAPLPGTNAKPFSFPRFLRRICRRLMIWALALVVAFIVPVLSCGFPLPFGEWEMSVTSQNKFTDVFMAVVAMVVLSGSNLFDNIIFDRKSINESLSRGIAGLILLLDVVFLIYGMACYGKGTGVPTPSAWSCFRAMLLIAIMGEVVIAFIED